MEPMWEKEQTFKSPRVCWASVIGLCFLVCFGDYNPICCWNWWLFSCVEVEIKGKREFFYFRSSFSSNCHVVSSGVGRGVFLGERKSWFGCESSLRGRQRITKRVSERHSGARKCEDDKVTPHSYFQFQHTVLKIQEVHWIWENSID